MNSTTAATSLASRFAVIQNYMAQYILTAIFVFGNVGNIGNIIIFSQKVLRTNVCSWYFILFSIGNLVNIYFGTFTRIIALWIGYDLTRLSIIFCKLRIYLLLLGLNLSRNFLALISIDRWMITSRNVEIRRLSSTKTAISFIVVTILFWVTFNSIVAIGYEINTNSSCDKRTDETFALAYIVFSVFSITGPLTLMIIFSILSILNVQSTIHRRILPVRIRNHNVDQRNHYRRKDLALIKLSLVQVTVYIILNLLDMYNTIYGFTSSKTIKTNDQMAIDRFIGTVGVYLLYLYCSITFWLYILTSKTFRKECKSTWKRCFRQFHL